MTTVYLICFVLGFVLSVLAAFTGLGRVHSGTSISDMLASTATAGLAGRCPP